MTKVHKSALGKSIDMAALRSKNEQVRAVGNMAVNARGDVIDANGRVINDNNKRVNEHYMKSVRPKTVLVNRPAERSTPAPDVTPVPAVTPVITPEPVNELTKDELEFEQDDLDFVRPEIEPKKKSSKKLD
jgi:hypothetical protein